MDYERITIKPCRLCGKMPHKMYRRNKGFFSYHAKIYCDCNEKYAVTADARTEDRAIRKCIKAWNKQARADLGKHYKRKH